MKNYRNKSNTDIAIIGMACRFPGKANSLEEYWENIETGVDVISVIPKDRWDIDKYYTPFGGDGTIKTRYGYFLDNISDFDSGFFGITSVEAQAIDPQQRLLLEVCQQAFDNAKLSVSSLNGSKSGVFIGLSNSDFLTINFTENKLSEIKENSLTGVIPSVASGRISYIYGLNGPCMTIDTACSSSLVSIDLAVNNLINNKCNLAIAGGVNLILTPQGHIALTKLNALSSDGKCKVFDDLADGYGRGEGCGVLILKRLSDAEKDGNHIRAVIRGSAVNHDGRSGGLTIPNGLAQQEVIQDAITQAGVTIDDINYVEVHGTGTKIGDPQEINALNNVFKDRDSNNPLLVGSVKSNIGHLESAAGVAGIIKLILSMEKGILPKSLHQKSLNSLIPWSKIPIEVVKSNMEWKNPKGTALLAGISSFGISGTNAHIILQEYKEKLLDNTQFADKQIEEDILTVSAKSFASLESIQKKYINFLAESSHRFSDICLSSRFCDQQYNNRLALVVESRDELKKKLEKSLASLDNSSTTSAEQLKIAFLFTGQGSQYFGMGKALYNSFSVFRDSVQKCDELFHPYLSVSITNLIYMDDQHDLSNTLYTQPVIFTIGYALTELLKSFNIKPSIVLGHSIGQYAAACISGIISLEDSIKLVSERAILMNKVKVKGEMIAVSASLSKLKSLLRSNDTDPISIAAINSPYDITLSGSIKSIKRITQLLKSNNITYQPLKVSHAFHSTLMEEIVEPFEDILSKIHFNKPNIPIISDLTGSMNDYENCSEITDSKYWSSHICSTINFSESLQALTNSGHSLFVEIGAMPVLSMLGLKSTKDKEINFISLLDRRNKKPMSLFLDGLAKLYNQGCNIDWSLINKQTDKKLVDLPNYCFEKTNYPINSSFNSYCEDDKSSSVSLYSTSSEDNTISDDLIKIIHQITGNIFEKDKFAANFISLGLDSLMIAKLKTKIEQHFALSIPIVDLYGDLNNFNDLIKYITKNKISTPDLKEAKLKTKDTNLFENSVNRTDKSSDISTILQNQLSMVQNVVHEQLNLLRDQKVKSDFILINSNVLTKTQKESIEKLQSSFQMAKFEEDDLSEKQREFLQKFIAKFNNKTKKSKDYNKKNKGEFAHYLTTINFRKTLKELLYPLVSAKAEGQYIWDIDGNQYIDIALGYGVHFFGHKPKFVMDAVYKQLEKGSGLSPRTTLPSEVTALIKELTNVERVSYCNTGSEAVMFALRIAKTVTGRQKIIKFSGSYHGVYDSVLVESNGKESYPSSSGVTHNVAEDVIVLPYGSDESIEIIKEIGHEIAAVLVEPVQSRNPSFQPKEFLHKLRNVTENVGSALIFDEIITGFRNCARGAQEFFDIQADIVTYGKLIGGGLPIGIVAGKSKFLNAIDGGNWNYGDNSIPESKVTFTAGTFSNHPLAMAAAKSVLLEIKNQGSHIYTQMANKMQFLVTSLNKYFEENYVPIRIKNFGALFRFESIGNYHLALNPIEMDIFFYLLMSKGIYTWERRICFLSTVHTDSDIKKILEAVKSSIDELRAGGFNFDDEKKPLNIASDSIKIEKMSSSQCRLFVLDSIKGKEKPYHLTGAMIVNGALEQNRVKQSIEKIADRHESLRTSFEIQDDEFVRIIHPRINDSFFEHELSNENNIEHHINKFIQHFDLANGPLLKIKIIKLRKDTYLFLMDFHHITLDGFSVNIFVQEFMEHYSGKKVKNLPLQFSKFQRWENEYIQSDEFMEDKQFWNNKFLDYTSPAQLPLDFNRCDKQSFEGNTIYFSLTQKETGQLASLAKKLNVTLYMLIFSIYNILVTKLTNQSNIVIGTPVALRDNNGFDEIIGMLTNTLVLKNNVEEQESFLSLVKKVRTLCIESFAHRNYPFEHLVNDLKITRQNGRNSVFDIDFVYEKSDDRVFRIEGLEFTPYHLNNQASICDFSFEVMEEQDILQFNFHYNVKLFKAGTVNSWKNYTKNIIQQILESPDSIIENIKLFPV